MLGTIIFACVISYIAIALFIMILSIELMNK